MSRKSHSLTESRSAVIVKNLLSLILVLYTLITIFLIGNAVLSSFKTKADLITNTMGFPKAFVLDNFRIVLGEDGFLRYLLNSVILVSLSIIFMISLSSSVAYGISMFNFRGRDFIQTYFLIGLMFPIQLGILPLFVIMNKLKLTNNFLPLILPGIASPIVFFYMKQYMESVLPLEIVEAARADGASEFRIFNQIVLPMLKPALAVQAVFTFVESWNNYLIPALLLDKAEMRTVPPSSRCMIP